MEKNGENTKAKYKYVIVNNPKDGLQTITGEELFSAIISGKLKITEGTKKIPGIDYNLIREKLNANAEKKDNNIDIVSGRHNIDQKSL